MLGRTRRATAVGVAAFVLTASAALAVPSTASAETKTVPCGSTVSAEPGDHIIGTTLLGIPVDLGIVTEGIGQLLNGLCDVTVTVVNTVVSPVPVVGAPVAGAVNGVVSNGTNSLHGATGQVGTALSGDHRQSPGQQQQTPVSPGNSQSPGVVGIPDANSQVLGGYPAAAGFGSLPSTFSTGYAPMRDYSDIPMVAAGLYSPAPGLRYGSQIPGYAPEFGILGQDGTKSSGGELQNAGEAEALPVSGGVDDGVGLPVFVAVLLLSGVSAGLVRTWVLRRMATAA